MFGLIYFSHIRHQAGFPSLPVNIIYVSLGSRRGLTCNYSESLSIFNTQPRALGVPWSTVQGFENICLKLSSGWIRVTLSLLLSSCLKYKYKYIYICSSTEIVNFLVFEYLTLIKYIYYYTTTIKRKLEIIFVC